MLKKVNIPEGTSGNWKVEKFEVSKDEAMFQNIRATFSFYSRGQYISPGIYTRLMRNNRVVMSDTPSEMLDHSLFVTKANGTVLLNGLGLGMVLLNVLDNPNVTNVFVNEISEDVINLVALHYNDPRITINHSDAFIWKPENGTKFNAIWHDIWDNICEDNKPEMTKLMRKYSRYKSDNGCYQDCWGRSKLLKRR